MTKHQDAYENRPRDEFNCCGGNDDTPQEHTRDCSVFDWVVAEQKAIIGALQGMVVTHRSEPEKKALRRAISMVRNRMGQ